MEYRLYRGIPGVTLYYAGGRSSSSSQHLHHLHLQHRMQGATSRRNGEARSSSRPKPANIPTTCLKKQRDKKLRWKIIVSFTLNRDYVQILYPKCDPLRQTGHVVGKHCFEI